MKRRLFIVAAAVGSIIGLAALPACGTCYVCTLKTPTGYNPGTTTTTCPDSCATLCDNPPSSCGGR